MEALERMPFTAQKKIFKRLADLADIKCLSQEDQEKYDESRKVADDYYSGLYGSYINGLEEGESKGLTKGLAQGMAKGLAKGMAQGEQKKSRDIALKMLEAGMPSAQIIVFTGLSEEELKSLK